MLPHHKMPAVRIIVRGAVRDRDGIGPLDVVPGNSAVVPHELDGVGQDEERALLAVLLNDGIGSAFFQNRFGPDFSTQIRRVLDAVGRENIN